MEDEITRQRKEEFYAILMERVKPGALESDELYSAASKMIRAYEVDIKNLIDRSNDEAERLYILLEMCLSVLQYHEYNEGVDRGSPLETLIKMLKYEIDRKP